jgi:hypothetical protein
MCFVNDKLADKRAFWPSLMSVSYIFLYIIRNQRWRSLWTDFARVLTGCTCFPLGNFVASFLLVVQIIGWVKSMSKKSKVSKLGFTTNSVETEITEIFEKSQKSQAIHNDCAKRLQKLLGTDNGSFRYWIDHMIYHSLFCLITCSSIFLEKIQQILLVAIQKRDDEETVERLMTFLTTFSCHIVATNREFFDYFIDSILAYVNVKQKDVRYRSCHLISSILGRLERSDTPFKFEYDSRFFLLWS